MLMKTIFISQEPILSTQEPINIQMVASKAVVVVGPVF